VHARELPTDLQHVTSPCLSLPLTCGAALPTALAGKIIEPFSFSFAGVKDVNGFNDLTRSFGAAAKLAQDPPALQLRIRPVARGAELSVSRVSDLLPDGFAPASIWHAHRFSGADVGLIRESDQASGVETADDAPGSSGDQVVRRPGPDAGGPHDGPARRGQDLDVYPMTLCFRE
jgi:hypothetical protein